MHKIFVINLLKSPKNGIKPRVPGDANSSLIWRGVTLRYSSLLITEIFDGFSLKKESQHPRVKYIKERVVLIISITKYEAQRLNKEYGVQFGYCGISSTYTKHKKFFLAETRNNLNALNEIRGIKPRKKKNKSKKERVGV